MAKKRMISTNFWSDPWVVDELNPLDRYLFLYFLTNEKTNISGAYELSLRTISNETGIEKEEVMRMLKRLESRLVYEKGWVILRKAVKHQNYRSPKIESALARELTEIPANVLQYIELPNNIGELLKERYGIDTVYIPYAYDIALNLTKPIGNNLTKPNLTKPNDSLGKPSNRPERVPTETIEALLAYWLAVVGNDVDTTGNRRAIASLLRQKNLDEQKLRKLVDGVAASLDDRFAPRIGDFVALKRKMNDLLIWGRKREAASNVEVIS